MLWIIPQTKNFAVSFILKSARFAFKTTLGKMKHLLALSLLLPFAFFTSAQAQQVNVYVESYCYVNTEQYIPGYYDRYGNYVSGYVNRTRNRVPCNNNPYGYGRATNPNCNPTRTILGATLGGSIGRSMTSTRNNRRNRDWATALGASLGGLAFSC
jgi:hypothetical protein